MCVCGENVDFGESDKTIKTSGNVDESKYLQHFSGNILYFIHRRTFSD